MYIDIHMLIVDLVIVFVRVLVLLVKWFTERFNHDVNRDSLMICEVR